MGAFTGKTVLILGGSRGIGAAIVRRFVTDGANVRFTYAGSKDAAKRLAQETRATAVFTVKIAGMVLRTASFVRLGHIFRDKIKQSIAFDIVLALWRFCRNVCFDMLNRLA